MLFEAYTKLVRDFPDECDQLFGQPLTEDGLSWLSVDGDRYPYLLFSAQREDSRSDIELRSVSVRFSRDCVIEAPDSTGTSGIYTVVRLNENDPDVVRVLLRVLGEVFRERNTPYSSKDIASRILELADLFKQIGDSAGDIVGLWGEMYILSRSAELDIAVQCWCRHKRAKHDYVTGDFALEAKTTLLSKRKHRFSLDQLRPSGDFLVYVASLAVVEVDSGKTTAEFIDELYDSIVDNDLRARFLAQCLIKGGRDVYRSTLKLNVFPDQESLRIFDARNIPVPEISPGAPISNIRFDVVLCDIPPIKKRDRDAILSFGAS